MTVLQPFNLAMRGVMEAGIVAGFAFWGWHAGTGPATKAALAIGAPVIGFGFWGAVDFHRAGAMAEPLRLIQELAISLLAALAFYAAGAQALAWALAALSLVHHALVYALGGRLLKR